MRAAAVLCCLAMLGGCGDPEPDTPQRRYRLGLYAGELSPLPTVTAALGRMKQRGYSIMVAVPAAGFPSAELQRLLQQAAQQGVEVRLWPLLAEADGYWPNETNIATFAAQVRKILAWLKDNSLAAGAIIYDMEPAIAYSRALEKGFEQGLSSTIELMKKHLDSAAHAKARAALKQSIREVQAAGLKAQCVTFPQVLDDLADGDGDLQDALDIPVHGLPWDEVSFMVYQTTYASSVGSWIGPDLVRRYAAEARKHFGQRATVALGVVGKHGVMSAGAKLYPDPATLAADIAAALWEKVGRVEIFSLDGVLAEAAPDAWLEAVDDVTPRQPASSSQADLVMRTMRGMDALLDAGK